LLGLVRLLINREPPRDFENRYRERTARALAADLQPVPGIRQALHHLRVPYCVASNGSHEKMRATLGLTGLLDGFKGRMFSANDVALPKPAPHLFLLAASTLGVAPEDTLVIEDTPVGVLAGRSAGMSTFGFARRTPGRRLRAAGASVVFTDMAELPGLLGGRSVEAGLVYAL
jgi:HAD superfamily hydrolase (TIGR01509 family)